jgi:hypothetical protein
MIKMDKEMIERYIGKIVRITIGIRNFVPPPGIIDSVSDGFILFRTPEKTSTIAISEIKEIVPFNPRY